jgi:quinol-cytochrome oxidoreductase complex cytochrome b subunit
VNTTFVLLSIGSIIFLVQAIPLALRVVKPNRFYGVRTKSTLSNADLWYRVNRIYGLAMIFATIAYFAICLIAGSWRPEVNHTVFNLLVFTGQVIVPVTIAMYALHRANKEASS